MVKRLKFFTIFSLVFLSIFVLASCGGNTPAENTTPTTTNGDSGTKSGDHQHSYDGWKYDDAHHWHECSCGDKKDLADHELTSTLEDATCDAKGSITYTCDTCGYTHSIEIDKLEHKVTSISYKDQLVAGSTCKHEYIGKGRCLECGDEVEVSRDEYFAHTYKAAIKTPATCSTPGKYEYTCTLCGDKYEAEYTDVDAHEWNEPTRDGSVLTYTCKHCNKAKQVIDAKTEVQATVSTTDLGTVKAVELKNATIELDDHTLAGLNGVTDLSIKADTVETETLTLDSTVKERIGDSQVFDFQMEADGNQVSSFDGYITVTIPYTLQPGDDVNAIVVWYLNDLGDPTPITAKYSNGFVSFDTNHFSLYVVVQMTPEEACAIFGHNYEEVSRTESTCSNYGIIVRKCTRCNKTETEPIPLKEHNWAVVKNQPATLNKEGFIQYQCSICKEYRQVTIPKLTNNDPSLIALLIDGAIKTIQTSGLEINATTIEDGEEATEIIQILLNGKIGYTLNISDDQINISKSNLINGAHESMSNNGTYASIYKSNASNNMTPSAISYDLVFGDTFRITNVLTKYISTDLLDEYTNKIIDLVLTSEVVDGKIVYTFDADKVLALYDDITTLTIQQLVDKYIGEGTYANIVKFVTEAPNKTVGQLMTEMNEFGIDIEGIIDFALNYVNYFTSENNVELPAQFDVKSITTMIALAKQAKVSDLLATSPVTIEQILAMLEQFKNLTIEDIIPMFMSSGNGQQVKPEPTSNQAVALSEAPAASESQQSSSFFPPKEYIEQMLALVTFELKLNDDYTLNSFEFELSGPQGLQLSVKPATNVVDKYNELAAEIKDFLSPVSIENFEQNAFGKAFNNTNGLNLTYTYTKDESKNIIKIKTSDFSVSDFIKTFDDKYYDMHYELYQNELLQRANKVFVVFNLNTNSTCYNYPNLNLVRANLYGSFEVYAYVNNDPKLVYASSSIYGFVNSIIYDKTSKSYFIGDSRDIEDSIYTYELYTGDIPQGSKTLEQGTYYEFKDVKGLTVEQIVLKGTNIFDSNDVVFYKSYAYKYNDKYLYHPVAYTRLDLYGYALEKDVPSIGISYYFDGTNLIEKFNDQYDWYLKDGEGVYTYRSYVSKNGKAKLEYVSKTDSTVTYKLTAGNNTKNFTLSIVDYYTPGNAIYSEDLEGCYRFNIYNAMNSTTQETTNTFYIGRRNSYHNYVETIVVEPTLTQNGVKMERCTKCDDHHLYDIAPTGQGSMQEVLFEQFDSTTYGIYTGSMYYTAYEILNSCDIRMVIVTVAIDPETGEETYQISESFVPAEASKDMIEYKIDGNTHTIYNTRKITFDSKLVEELKNQLDENSRLVIATINYYSSNPQLYFID